MPAVTNNNPTWLKLMRALGAPIPEAPLLQRASGAWRDDELQDVHYTYLGQGSFIDLALPGIRSAAEGQRQGIVVDATGWTDLRALDELLAMLQPRIAQLKANDRIVLLSHTTSGVDWQRATIAEALTGFCKSLAKELGSKGITVNQLQVVARGEEATLPWLAFLLSKRSAFVTGQSIAVSIPRRHIGLKPAALQDKVVAITGAAQGIGLAIASQFAAEGAKVIGIDRPGNPALQSAMAAINAQALELDITATDAPQRIRDLAQQLGSGLTCWSTMPASPATNASRTCRQTIGRVRSTLICMPPTTWLNRWHRTALTTTAGSFSCRRFPAWRAMPARATMRWQNPA